MNLLNKNEKWLFRYVRNHWDVILILLFVASTHLIHLSADPPMYLSSSGGLFGDESALAHNARNKVLFGVWKTDGWNPIIYNPILTGLEYVSFSVAGVGLAQLRVVNVIATLLGFYLLFFALKEASGRRVAVFATVLLCWNYTFLMYTRLGLNDAFLFFPMALTFYFFVKGLSNPSFFLYAGISSFACYITKASALYYILAVLFTLAIGTIRTRITREKPGLPVKSILWYLLGLAASYGAWYGFFFLPNKADFGQVGQSWLNLAAPHSLARYWHNLSSFSFFRYLRGAPVVVIVSWISLPILIYSALRDWTKSSSVLMLSLLWLFGGYFSLNGLNYRPLRYFIPLIPAICIVTSFALDKIWRFSFYKNPVMAKLTPIRWLIPIVVIVLWTGILLFRVTGFKNTTRWTGEVVGVWVIAGICLYLYKRFDRRESQISKKGVIGVVSNALVMTMLLVSFYHQIPAYFRWVRNPNYSVVDTSRELGKILEKAYIGGLWSPLATIENKHRALYVGNHWFNYIDTFKIFHLTHLFLWDGNNREELRFLRHAYPEIMQNAHLINTYNIKGKPVRLFKITYPAENTNDQTSTKK